MRGFSPGAGGYSRLAVYLLPSGLRPFPGPVCCSGAVSFWKGADGFCCAGAVAGEDGLGAVGGPVSVSLRLRRGWWAEVLKLGAWGGVVGGGRVGAVRQWHPGCRTRSL